MKRHNGFCYETDGELLASLQDQGAVTTSGKLVQYTALNTSANEMTILTYGLDTQAASTQTIPMILADCTVPGPMVGYLGVPMQDAIMTSWGVVAVWVMAFAFRMMIRSSRGY
jgi:hypothetical protein